MVYFWFLSLSLFLLFPLLTLSSLTHIVIFKMTLTKTGALALAYYYSEHQTGVHMLIPGICNFLVMTYHPQVYFLSSFLFLFLCSLFLFLFIFFFYFKPNELMSLLHWSFGGLFLVASLFRVVEKIPGLLGNSI